MNTCSIGSEDYNGSSKAVNVPPGVMMQTFMINIIDNNIEECIERFNVRIISVTTCRVTVGNNNISEVIITDDDSKLNILYIVLENIIGQ